MQSTNFIPLTSMIPFFGETVIDFQKFNFIKNKLEPLDKYRNICDISSDHCERSLRICEYDLVKVSTNVWKVNLKQPKWLNNLRFFKITKAMLLIADENRISTIAEILNVSTRTIFYWLSKFLAERFSWLLGYHYHGRGRNSKLTPKQKQKLYQIVDQGPEKYGFDCGVWTSAMITEVILREFKVTYNPRYLCFLLKKIGLSYQKAAFVSDHLDEEKRKHWLEVTWPAIFNCQQHAPWIKQR